MKKKISIEGMMCEHCVSHVKSALEALEDVASVEVSLEGKYAIVDTIVSNSVLETAIEEEGYTVTGISEDK